MFCSETGGSGDGASEIGGRVFETPFEKLVERVASTAEGASGKIFGEFVSDAVATAPKLVNASAKTIALWILLIGASKLVSSDR